jgi:hypothetical protein
MNAACRNSSLSGDANTEKREGVGAIYASRAWAPRPRPPAGPDGRARTRPAWAGPPRALSRSREALAC